MFSFREKMELGSSPYDEDCVQVSKGDYIDAMKEECRRYKSLLEENFPIPEDIDAYFTIKANPHDFGTYYEVCISYDPDDEKQTEFALFVEGNLPRVWDDTKKMEFNYVPESQEVE